MKVRYGFVTNSSSSSFVIAFKDKNAIAEDVEHIFANCPCDFSIGAMTSEEIVEHAKANLLRDIERDHITIKELRKKLREEFSMTARRIYYYNTRKFYTEGREYLESDEYKKLANDYIESEMAKVLKQLEGKDYVVYTSFSDNDGCIGSYMEHDVMPRAKNTICSFSHH